jgi:hypothetical protein
MAGYGDAVEAVLFGVHDLFGGRPPEEKLPAFSNALIEADMDESAVAGVINSVGLFHLSFSC